MSAATGDQQTYVDHLVAGLVGGGVTHAVVSPGSRSTPIVQSLRVRDDVEVEVVVDERAAGFFALGMARAGAVPLLVCTSGSAPAHYLPALMEARRVRLPLVVLSADRPAELRHRGANQTTDQAALFGAQVKRSRDLDAGAPVAPARVARMAAEEVAFASDFPAGPVHLNVGLRKPLEATPPARAPLPTARPALRPGAASMDGVAPRLVGAGLVVGGPAPRSGGEGAEGLARFLAASGAVLATEACAGYRGRGALALDAIVATEAGRASLDSLGWVLGVGEAPLGGATLRWLASLPADVELLWCSEMAVDPEHRVDTFLVGEVDAALAALAAGVGRSTPDLARLGVAVVEARAELLDEGEWSSLRAIHDIVSALPPETRLVLGNSLVPRLVETFSTLGERPDLVVYTQRGLAGIDGLLAGAAGALAAEVPGHPMLVLLGDVSFRHDLASLALLREPAVPVVVVVLDNRGGRIFEQLPIHDAVGASTFERYFATPDPGLAWAPLADALGAAFATIEEASALEAALADALAAPGLTLLRVRVPASSAREDLADLAEAIDERLAGQR